jgi:hypothetical protein
MKMAFALLLLASSAQIAAAEPIVDLTPQVEIELALSAAPDHLRSQAGVYRLGPRGYERVRDSRNGFNCLVSREPNTGIGPICYDREGSATTLKADLMRGKLRRQGRSTAAIDAAIDKGYHSGTLKAPRKAGVVYMLSTKFQRVSPKTGKAECIFPPHMMFYAPYLKNADIGAEHSFGSTHDPWILNEGKPYAVILVVQHDADVNACA